MNKATNSGNGKRRPFSKTEDDVLRGLVSRYGDDWGKIATEHKSITGVDRSPREVRDRYVNYLSNYIQTYPPLSPEEVTLLNKLVEKFGNSWQIFRDKIAKFFPNRTAGNLYNFYKSNNGIKPKRIKCTQEELISLWKITEEYFGAHNNLYETFFNAKNNVEYRKWEGFLLPRNTKLNKIKSRTLDPGKVFDQNSLQILGLLQNTGTLDPNKVFELPQNNVNSIPFKPHLSIEDYSISSLLNPKKLELKPIDGSFIHNYNIPPLMPNQQNQEI